MQYRGDVEIVERDATNHRAVMKVRARETRGQGTANATATLQLAAVDGQTQGDVHVDVDITGRAASTGQGAIQDVTSKLVGRFARNLTRMLDGGAPEAPTDEDALSAGEIASTVIKGRLSNPVVAGGVVVAAAVAVGAVILVVLRARRGRG
jgi:hypothetical protein